MKKVPDLAGLVRYVRTPLGWLLVVSALLLICLPFVPQSLSPETDRIARYVVLGVVVSLVALIIVFVLKRTPRKPPGLVASEDYYIIIEQYLNTLQVYGQKYGARTRIFVLKAGGASVRLQELPPAPEKKEA